MSQHRYELPTYLLEALEKAASDEQVPAADRVAVAVLVTFGFGLWMQAETIDPTAFAIPEHQWKRIAEALMLPPQSSVGTVNLGLDWMNLGPSAYTEEAVTGG